ncbi:MAG: signal peptide peptidase SppA [Bacteriovoracaceae bacterium]|nr:signal peptide peptidase SppA [Bacteriovoracaceae bacterium]
MSRERSKGIVGIFALITVLFVVFMVFAFFTISSLRNTSDLSAKALRGDEDGPIGVITIDGAIMESKKVVQLLHAAEEEESIKAILIRVDSPGGAVAPTQEIYEEIRRIDAKKPVFSSFGSIAASGGYYIGAATRKIYANAGSLTGSIGVIMQFADLSELFAFAKFKPGVIKAGKYKDIGSPNRPMTEEEKMILTKSLAVTHKQFINDILKTREDRLTKKPEEFAQGQIFNGEEALEIGLVDELAGMWEAGRRIHKDLKIKEKFGLRFIKSKKKRMSLSDLLQDGEETLSHIKESMVRKSGPAFLLPW